MSFSTANGGYTNTTGSITLTFSEAVYADDSETAFTASSAKEHHHAQIDQFHRPEHHL